MLTYPTQVQAQQAAQSLTELRVLSKHSQVAEENAPSPYTTLILLEDAAYKFNWSGEYTMQTAQSLFEHGPITYPRTDSTFISSNARQKAEAIIRFRYGSQALPGKGFLSVFVPSEESDGAHEAIRPTDPNQTPEDTPGLLPGQADIPLRDAAGTCPPIFGTQPVVSQGIAHLQVVAVVLIQLFAAPAKA
ncbi:MAG: hypothetical protein JXA13_17325 [Anaerolineales bacterium]|nr:hypothetical protein [Anaerolineales bacterium]